MEKIPGPMNPRPDAFTTQPFPWAEERRAALPRGLTQIPTDSQRILLVILGAIAMADGEIESQLDFGFLVCVWVLSHYSRVPALVTSSLGFHICVLEVVK